MYNRLPQGASSSAAIFQRVMDQVLKGIYGVYCYLHDVLIAGKDILYGKFIPNLSSRLSCLYRLLKKDVKFVWTDECRRVFGQSKQTLLSSKL